MTSLTFYGGVGEIGGNKILLEDGDTRVFLDFGQPFTFGEDFFTGYLAPRERFGLRDYFALKLMPEIPGLYSEKVLEPTDFPYSQPEFDAVFISHIHYDHVAHLSFLDEEIPVYLGETALRMLESWTTTMRNSFGEHPFHTFKTGDRLKVGSLEIEPVHVDHSTPSAYGFIIHTSEGSIAYTGDFRLHGPHAWMSRDFIERLEKETLEALICEGTRVAPVEKRENLSEEGVFKRADRLIKQAKGLVITTFYGRDIDRMKTYHELAKRNNRRFVVSAKTAHLLKALVSDPGIDVPDPTGDEHMLIYSRDMLRRDAWERALLDEHAGACVTSEYIREHQEEIILHLDFTQLTELIDIRPKEGSIFINSLSEPFEEDDIEDEIKNNWLSFFNLPRYQAHASGHCSKEEIFQALRKAKARSVFPVHTEHPEMFKEVAKEAVVVEKERTYRL
ncbi:MAG: MBL fold metallo-hydrolase [Methanobacteriota archaeon]|nr:MAG: MBL fold metallo-hydrolase [Euryarchaeota archaeon]